MIHPGAPCVGMNGINGDSQVSIRRGLATNEATRIRPHSPGGCVAAIEIATGPENDSPTST